MSSHVRFLLDSPGSFAEFVTALAERYTLRRLRSETRERVYWDTFDWRVFRRGARLSTEAGGALALELTGEGRVLRADVAGSLDFAEHLPAGEARERLDDWCGPRRLFPLVVCPATREGFEIVDKRDKVLARVLLQTRAAGAPQGPRKRHALPASIEVQCLRGYREGDEIVEWLRTGRSLSEFAGDELVDALGALGRRAGVNPSKPDLTFEPGASATAAALVVLEAQRGVILANEDGVQRDWDIEFLHDYRVAVRRSRAVLAEMRKALPPGLVETGTETLRWLGGLTGELRDLDVFLEKWPEYRAGVPELSDEDAAALRAQMQANRDRALSELAQVLESEVYSERMSQWTAALAAARGSGPVEDARRFVARRIWRRFRRVLSAGRAVGPDDDVALHELRKQGKKLRYLLELFGSLFPKEELVPAVRALKKFQSVLGDVNDYLVHEERTTALAEGAHGGPELMVAVGRVAAYLARGRKRKRSQFESLFEGFDTEENRARYQRLFKLPRDAQEVGG